VLLHGVPGCNQFLQLMADYRIRRQRLVLAHACFIEASWSVPLAYAPGT